jgi:hypothetical protein
MFCKFTKIKTFSIKQAEAADLINNEVKILNNKKKRKKNFVHELLSLRMNVLFRNKSTGEVIIWQICTLFELVC